MIQRPLGTGVSATAFAVGGGRAAAYFTSGGAARSSIGPSTEFRVTYSWFSMVFLKSLTVLKPVGIITPLIGS